MMELQQALGDYSPQSSASPSKAERLIEIYEEQGLHGFLEDAYGFAAVTYNGVGDAERARNFTRLALEAAKHQNGPHASNLGLYHELLADPKRHWSWRYKT